MYTKSDEYSSVLDLLDRKLCLRTVGGCGGGGYCHNCDMGEIREQAKKDVEKMKAMQEKLEKLKKGDLK